MSAKIRRFDPKKDYKALSIIYNQSFHDLPNFLPYTTERIGKMMRSRYFPKGGIFIAEVNNHPIGAITAYYNEKKYKHRGCIIDWAVIPKYRKTGVGKQLFDKAYEQLMSIPMIQKIDTYEDIIYSNGNRAEPAKNNILYEKFFKKIGFKEIGSFSNMQLSLHELPTLQKFLDRYQKKFPISIRKMERTAKDYKTYFKIDNKINLESFSEFIQIYDDPKTYIDELDQEFHEIFFAILDHKPIGLVGISINKKINEFHQQRRGFITTVGVLKKYRNKGAGSHLIYYAISLLHSHGMNIFELSVDNLNKTNAKHLYSQMGFSEISKSLLYRKHT